MSDVMSHFPRYFQDSNYLKIICSGSDDEFERLKGASEQAAKSVTAVLADETGLKSLEDDYRITDSNDSKKVRVSMIQAKKRGFQATTKVRLTEVIRALDIDAEIIENIPDYSFDIILRRNDVYEVVSKIVEELKPAHLGTGYKFLIPDISSSVNLFTAAAAVKARTAHSMEIPNEGEAALPGHMCMSSGVSAKARGKICEQKKNTYGDLLRMGTYGDLTGKTYAEILYKEI